MLAAVADTLPGHWSDALGEVRVEWRDDLPPDVHGRAYAGRILLRKALLADDDDRPARVGDQESLEAVTRPVLALTDHPAAGFALVVVVQRHPRDPGRPVAAEVALHPDLVVVVRAQRAVPIVEMGDGGIARPHPAQRNDRWGRRGTESREMRADPADDRGVELLARHRGRAAQLADGDLLTLDLAAEFSTRAFPPARAAERRPLARRLSRALTSIITL